MEANKESSPFVDAQRYIASPPPFQIQNQRNPAKEKLTRNEKLIIDDLGNLNIARKEVFVREAVLCFSSIIPRLKTKTLIHYQMHCNHGVDDDCSLKMF